LTHPLDLDTSPPSEGRGWLGQRAARDANAELEEAGSEEYVTLTGVEDEGEMFAS
jgi:hypothetical protein